MIVLELIEKLQKIDSSCIVVIKDADTSWLLVVQEIEESLYEGRKTLVLKSDYQHELRDFE